MKNKSKLNKIRQGVNKKASQPSDWLYLNDKELTVFDIKAALSECNNVNAQVWEAVGVIEIEFPEAKSIDIEAGRPDLGDEYSNEFLAKNKVKSLFYVTIDPDNYVQVEKVFKVITSKAGGFFCGDTDEFTPEVR